MVQEFLSGVDRVTDGPYGQVRTRRDWSYCADRYWRPGMVLIGDAACFVDPVLSSGVHLATYGALLAARSINSTLRGDIPEPVAFDEFESRYRREYAHFYEFLVSFYDRHVDEHSYFWTAKKLINHPAGELAAFTSLVSGLSSADRVLTGADEDIWMPPRTDAFTPAGRFPDWDTDQHIRFDAHHPLFETEPWVPGLPNQGPRPGGLVPAEDGLHWAVPQPTPVGA
jgi:halogenation protein CepH